ncbi:C-8 sterol isomerase, putative [Trypanosoma equiperdum]|uniref:C-8 sterol isomerase, putative n=2 Tax=Trypanozoon TaxID=39700 RepID=Q582S0_TRYB2|nr:C-8 sterol isomerase, putative [Trypanosoma brucei brucei TREU927]AAX80634.1 C-8 sterol isomerase, putative [Trypanosoma brucei]AAZ10498.1 C-8 sterol isomerase, putative [Trypanosoma brucei brucei TREU927]SCU67270.1 C-8 sterol isomerase, putative [Trypanosoma equiperdum]
MGLCKTLFVFLLTVTLAGFVHLVNRPENWVFDPKELQTIVKQSISNARSKYGDNPSADAVIAEVIEGVLATYPAHTTNSSRWMWNNAGGAMGSMKLLHASFSEYIIIFGTAVGTEGHTGRYHLAEDFFTIIHGEQWAALPNSTVPEVYKPGDQHYLPKHTAKQYKMPGPCFALEYARGVIPSMFFFGFADMFSSTLDMVTLYHTVVESTKQMIPNALRGKI